MRKEDYFALLLGTGIVLFGFGLGARWCNNLIENYLIDIGENHNMVRPVFKDKKTGLIYEITVECIGD